MNAGWRRGRTRCCGKATFRTELDAKIALASTQRSQSSRREECRWYRCSSGRWHLTSKK